MWILLWWVSGIIIVGMVPLADILTGKGLHFRWEDYAILLFFGLIWPLIVIADSYTRGKKEWIYLEALKDILYFRKRRAPHWVEQMVSDSHKEANEKLIEKDYEECLKLIEYDKYGRYGEHTYDTIGAKHVN